MTTVSISTAAGFLKSLGINTHITYSGTSYTNLTAVESDLAYLGISHIRDALPASNGSNMALYTSLVADGISFNFGGASPSLPNFISALNSFVTQFPGRVLSIEGANEVLNWPVTYNGLTGLPAAAALQEALYAAVKADPLLSSLPVYNFTFGGGGPSTYAPVGNLSAYVDDGNVHLYPQGSDPTPYDYLVANIPWQTSVDSPGKPTVITEGGYYTMPDQNYGVNTDVQAKYTLDFVLDGALLGVKADYLYELIDEYADPGNTNSEDHYGLFNNDGTPKPAATALHNLTTRLADPGDNAATGTGLVYTVANLPSDGHSLEFVKVSGQDDIVVWAEPIIWNNTTDKETAAPVSNVIVNLGASYQSVSVYDPMLGTTAIETLTNVSSVNLALTDHPLIIEVSPNAAAPLAMNPSINNTVVTATSTAVTDASGNTWTITSSGQVAVDGTTDTSTSGVIELAYVNGTIWEENSNNLWWGKSSPSASWSPGADPLPAASSSIALDISEDAWQGDAQFTVAVDGAQVGGTMTASALHSTGDSNIFTLPGSWSTGSHSVQISFINDVYGGSPTTDRNLYVNAIAFNGTTQSNSTATMLNNGTDSFTVGGSTAAATAPTDALTLNLAEDAWNGNAQFTLTIDGKQISTPQNVTALHSTGAWEAFSYAGNFGAGSHTIGVSFTNDAYGGSPSTDRNLYINGITVNGTQYGSGVTTMLNNGTTNFAITTTH